MIRPTDSLLLSYTKLKTRKIRLTITVIISALLFACLVFIAITSTGAIHSLQSFGEEGYGGRYLVQAFPLSYNNNPQSMQQAVDKLKPTQDDLVRQKKALAKKLDLQYDETTDQTLPLLGYKDPGGQMQYYLNYGGSKVAQQYVQQLNAAIPGTSYEAFKATAERAGATKTYQGGGSGMSGGGQPPYVGVLTNGKEDLEKIRNPKTAGPSSWTGVQTITTLGWKTIDNALLSPFVLPGQNLATGKDGSVPVVAPMSAAEEILGLQPLPQTAPPAAKLKRLTEVRQSIAGKTAQLCYRNSVSSNLLSQALQQDTEIAANKNSKDYTPPALIYQIPTDACTAISIKSDKRSAEEKKQAENQQAFDKEFGQETEQSQGIVTVRIVGLSPDVNFGSSSLSATSILTSLFSSSLGTGWTSPADTTGNPLVSAIQSGGGISANPQGSYYAEFGTLKAMKQFIENQTCKSAATIPTPGGTIVTGTGPESNNYVEACSNQHRPFSVTTYGNSAGAIEEFRSSIWRVARFLILAVVLIAALIMMGNVGKIIADSRRETAVFRALGAKRSDIAQIYLGYTTLLSLLVAGCAFVFGGIGAYFINQRYSGNLSVTAVITYGAQDVHKRFTLFGLDIRLLGAVLGLVILAGLLSASIPLLTNMRRNPIRDMRNDT